MQFNEDRNTRAFSQRARSVSAPEPVPPSPPPLATMGVLAESAAMTDLVREVDRLSTRVQSMEEVMMGIKHAITGHAARMERRVTDIHVHSAVSSTGHTALHPNWLSSAFAIGDYASPRHAASYTGSFRPPPSPRGATMDDDALQYIVSSDPPAWLGPMTYPGITALTVSTTYRIEEWIIPDWSHYDDGSQGPRYYSEFYSWQGGYSMVVLVWPNARQKRATPRMQVELQVIPSGYQHSPGYQLSCQLTLLRANGDHIETSAPLKWASETASESITFELPQLMNTATQSLRLQCRINTPPGVD